MTLDNASFVEPVALVFVNAGNLIRPFPHAVCSDGAFPIVKKLTATTDPSTAFDGCQIALLVGAMPRKGNMTRADLLKKNAGIFKAQGRLINKYADRDVKVLVVGNPANANAMVAAHYAPDIPKANFHALTRLDQNRAVSMLGEKLGCDASKIRNAIVWGNHSSTMYPDVNSGHVSTSSGTKPLREAINDNKWLETSFLKAVRGRGSAIIKALGASSAASAANAACDHIRDWFLGTPQDKYVSMSVPSDGSYGVPEGSHTTRTNAQTCINVNTLQSACICCIHGYMDLYVGQRNAAHMHERTHVHVH